MEPPEPTPHLISYCLPCHRRLDDLERAWPAVVQAANASPPIEIVLVDYGEQEPLAPIVAGWDLPLDPLNSLVIPVFRGWPHYHMAHARNVSIKAASGEYIVISSADICPKVDYFAAVRGRLGQTHATWLYPFYTDFVGVIVCRREELLEAGGYDERFEFYGGEDKDLQARLRRRRSLCADYDATSILEMFLTSNKQKVRGYRLPMRKKDMQRHALLILRENNTAACLVANKGRPWGLI